MFNYSKLLSSLKNISQTQSLSKNLPPLLDKIWEELNHGDFDKWFNAYKQLPDIIPSKIDLESSFSVGVKSDCKNDEYNKIEELLRTLQPWRKGPFNLFDIFINTEWHSDWKWDRLKNHISPLKDRVVLDVGCGNGYHCWRMVHHKPKLVIGIDPNRLFAVQFHSIKHFLREYPVYLLPFTLEQIPVATKAFDSIFSMGVLYHRRSPMDHLLDLKGHLSDKGELILETLIIDGKEGEVLVPQKRYAQMNNVWFIPSALTLEIWLKRCGYKNIRTVHISDTTIKEQRSTDWMKFDSLPQFLDKDNPKLTIEGYPAPKRAIIIANNF